MSVEGAVTAIHPEWTPEEIAEEVATIYREFADFRPAGDN